MFSWLILRWTSGDVKDSTLLTRTCGFLVFICSASVSGGEQVRDTNLNPSLARSVSHHTQRWALLAKVTVFGPQKMALRVAKSKFWDHFYSSNIPQIWSLRLLFHEFFTFGPYLNFADFRALRADMIVDIYISISMETFEHRKYKIRGDDGNN